MVAPFYISISSVQEFQFSNFYTNTCYFLSFLLLPSVCKIVSHDFDLHFSSAEYLFMYLLSIWISSHICRWILYQLSYEGSLTYLLRNLYAGQETTVRIGHGTTDWFQIGKWVRQGCILLSCLFNLCAEYIMRNAGLEEVQTGIKIAGRNINNLRYADSSAAAAAKLLQSCPTLCDPIDSRPPGSPIPGILQARTLVWVAISFSNAWKWSHSVMSKS